MISGLIGVPAGSFLAQRLRVRYPRADAYICACGLICSAPILFAASLYANNNVYMCYTLIFIGELFLNLNWSIVADILLGNVLLFSRVNLVFGGTTMVSGVIGVPLGSYLSRTLRRFSLRYDALICAVGLFVSAAFTAGVLLGAASWNHIVLYTVVFLAELAININWSIVSDMLLVRRRRLGFPLAVTTCCDLPSSTILAVL
ncbi:Protein spinster 3 [Homalodisca vitripennis]|nr:Protein spinster 3 [Homalodisca vitripennis]